MFAIIAFLIYYLIGRNSCDDGFTISMEDSPPKCNNGTRKSVGFGDFCDDHGLSEKYTWKYAQESCGTYYYSDPWIGSSVICNGKPLKKMCDNNKCTYNWMCQNGERCE